MGYRGSKSLLMQGSIPCVSVKEQRVDGSSVYFKYCKVYSSHRETGIVINVMRGLKNSAPKQNYALNFFFQPL